MKIAVVGVTGLVGNMMLRVLEERNFPLSELILVASEKSVGKEPSVISPAKVEPIFQKRCPPARPVVYPHSPHAPPAPRRNHPA